MRSPHQETKGPTGATVPRRHGFDITVNPLTARFCL
jgi:hypothetical protein